jgi:hypothetical protein
MHLLFFIGVAEDDDLVVTKWPKKVTIEVVKEFLGKLYIPQGIKEDIFIFRRHIHH